MNELEVKQEEIERLNLRSEEVREIMGYIPSRIVRYGISVILGVVVLIFTGTCFFRYPDTISGRFVIHSSNPAITLRSKVNGGIELLNVKDGDRVARNDLLAVVSGSGDYRHILGLKAELCVSDSIPCQYTDTLKLGEVQSYYTAYGQALSAYRDYMNIDYMGTRIRLTKEQLEERKEQLKMYRKTEELNQKSLTIEKSTYLRQEAIYEKGGISLAELEQGQSRLVLAEAAYNNACMATSQAQLGAAQAEQELLEMKIQRQQEICRLKDALKVAAENLNAAIREWESNYCMISSIDGIVSLAGVWKLHQNVIAGQDIVSVVPEKRNEILARLYLPVQGAGKLKEGNRMNLVFADYPQEEYGVFCWRLEKLSLLPDSVYTSTFYLPDTLRTNYGKILPFHQNMTGRAVVITEDLSFFDRVINPLRKLWKH